MNEIDAGPGSAGAWLPLTSSDPNGVALISPEGDRTWVSLEANVRRFANGIAGLGIEPGERVALMSHNRPEFVEAMLGCFRAGVRYVPINWHLTAAEVSYVLGDSGAVLLITDASNADVGRAAAEGTAVERVLVVGDSYDTWMSDQPDHEPANTVAGAPLLYTSGTTGRQKGVVRSDASRHVDQVIPDYRALGDIWRYTDGGVHLCVCPLYHAAPPAQVMFALTHSQSVVLRHRFDAEETLRLIQEHRVTTIHLVPTQIIRILRLPDEVKRRYDLTSLRGLWHGAAPCPDWAKRGAIDLFGPVVIEYFGSSEGTGPLIATSDEWLERPGTVGRAGRGLEVTAVDSAGRTLPPGDVGTLYFRRAEGPPTYHGDPDKTRRARLPDGRFTVGDVGWVDPDGFVFLADREVDMIISGGANIYPSETEGVLTEHPDVIDCAVFGIPDEEWGEQVKAAVQLRPDARPDADAIIAFCRERLAAYKCPRSIDFHDELPREASGKLKKRLLRAAYWPSTGDVHRDPAAAGRDV